MRYIFCLFSLLFLIACGSSATKSGSTGDASNALADSSEAPPAPANDGAQASTTISVVDTKFQPDRALTPYRGNLRFSAAWTERTGRNILIISGKVDLGKGEGREEIFAYQYRQTLDAWAKVWDINDFVDGVGCDLQIALPAEAIHVQDVDGDGSAEVIFLYTLDNRCDASLVRSKLLLHSKGNKYAIRGYSAQYLGPPQSIMNEQLKAEGQNPMWYKELDTAFEQAPPAIKGFASSTWDRYISAENKANQ